MSNETIAVLKDVPSEHFQRLLFMLDPDRERAGGRYEEIRQRLIQFFHRHSCFPAEDLADKTFDTVARRISSETIHNVVAFVWGVARNVKREAHKHRALVNIDEVSQPARARSIDPEVEMIHRVDNQRQIKCLYDSIQQLPLDDRELFLAYEYYTRKAKNTQKLVARFGLSPTALQTRAHRLKCRVEQAARKAFYAPVQRKKEENNVVRFIPEARKERLKNGSHGR